MRNKWIAFALSGPLLAVIIAGFVFAFFPARKHAGEHPVYIGDQTMYVEIADTEASRELGLGGRKGLAPDEGMLFVFPIEGKFSFWMKDMKFPIDILWIASDGSIVYSKENVSPDTYPETFAPDTGLAKYVLELPAGFSAAHHIDIGEKVAW